MTEKTQSNIFTKPKIFQLLRKDKIVATLSDTSVMDYTSQAPILIQKNRLEDWKAIRTQDLNRPNSRSLRRMLGLSTSNSQDISPLNYYQSISDAYWIKEQDEKKSWDDIQFTDDRFFKITLTGKGLLDNPKIYERKESPEHSNTGSFEKGWKYLPNQKNKWQLWKAGSPEAVWSEVFYSKLANKIFPGIATDYWEQDHFSVCDSFIDRENYECLEPYFSFTDSHHDPNLALKLLPEQVHDTYRKMLFLDAIMFNWDRHEFNFGLIRDKNDNISLQPLYDFNLCLFNGATPGSKRFEDTTIKMYNAVKTETFTVKKEWIVKAYQEVGFNINATLEQTLDFIITSSILAGARIE